MFNQLNNMLKMWLSVWSSVKSGAIWIGINIFYGVLYTIGISLITIAFFALVYYGFVIWSYLH